MFDAIFKASNGQSFAFGYAAGVLWSCDPLGDLPVELETSQGYQQVGATVDSRSISGVTRTITGRILRNADYCKRQLRDIFAPGVTGRLTVAGKYWCDAEVQRCPAISPAVLWPTFSFQLYCPNPYWHSVAKTTAATIKVTPVFRLPVCYTSHQYGIREQASYIRILNSGLDTRSWKLSLTARGEVVNPASSRPCRTVTSCRSTGKTASSGWSGSSTAKATTSFRCWTAAAPSGRYTTGRRHGSARRIPATAGCFCR